MSTVHDYHKVVHLEVWWVWFAPQERFIPVVREDGCVRRDPHRVGGRWGQSGSGTLQGGAAWKVYPGYPDRVRSSFRCSFLKDHGEDSVSRLRQSVSGKQGCEQMALHLPCFSRQILYRKYPRGVKPLRPWQILFSNASTVTCFQLLALCSLGTLWVGRHMHFFASK